VAPGLSTRQANVADDAANPTARREHSGVLGPDLVEFRQERFVIFDMT